MLHLYKHNLHKMIQQNKEARFRLLNALYQFTEGRPNTWVSAKELAQSEGIPFDEAAFQFLLSEGLIKPYGAAFTCYISHEGIKAIEAAYEDINQPTKYFPAISKIKPLNG